MKRILWTLVASSLLWPSFASAQQVEITPFVAYRFGGEISTEYGYDPFDDAVDESSAAGVTVDFALNRNLQLELLYSTQETELFHDLGPFLPAFELTQVDLDYYHVGILYQWSPGQVKPYVVGSLGGTRFDFASFENLDRFSFSLGGGVKVMLADNIGIRLEGRGFWTLIDDDDGFCDGFRCYRGGNSVYLTQGQVSGGLILAF